MHSLIGTTGECSSSRVRADSARYLALALIKPIHQRRRRSKLVSYGGPLNTGWRVKNVVKIINGFSTRTFSYRQSTATAGCIRQKGQYAKISTCFSVFSFLFLFLLFFLFPSSYQACRIFYLNFYIQIFYLNNCSNNYTVIQFFCIIFLHACV